VTLRNNKLADPAYWFRTSGRDLSNMIEEAGFPQECQQQFLGFYQNTICPELGASPHGHTSKSAVGWDGSPLEYSFEFKKSSRQPGVRFAVDLTPRRPENITSPLNVDSVDRVLAVMRQKTPQFDDSWVPSPNGDIL
jgi:DMATS type aromatic prenyltransferase